MREVLKLLASGQSEMVIRNIYFTAIKSFAQNHGTIISPYKDAPPRWGSNFQWPLLFIVR